MRPTLAPFPANGVGVLGVSGIVEFALDPAGPRGLGEPYECLLDPSNPAPPIAFCIKGEFPGEKGEPALLPDFGLPDRGEFEKLPMWLAGDPLGVGVLATRGGVLYCEPGVGGFDVGGKPRSFLCAGVRGISERSSGVRMRGQNATKIL